MCVANQIAWRSLQILDHGPKRGVFTNTQYPTRTRTGRMSILIHSRFDLRSKIEANCYPHQISRMYSKNRCQDNFVNIMGETIYGVQATRSRCRRRRMDMSQACFGRSPSDLLFSKSHNPFFDVYNHLYMMYVALVPPSYIPFAISTTPGS
ncbi:uncharacterized protein EDB91DRAFT_473546 [Suillus paluster]|uniref:uncharacterized protein n=1 Tax=Suillus paluster TaxID=48578 RepID=UPI001B883C42|nr:uncharacterized protein EDB91DRAFT_473546 [Suillus paluster]KAG1737889.1 hypothetical protein EDB91DRAFT_473546 [Suillus paluster]